MATTVVGTGEPIARRSGIVLVALAHAVNANSVTRAVERTFENGRNIAECSRPSGDANADAADTLPVVVAVEAAAGLVTGITEPAFIAFADAVLTNSVSRTIHGARWGIWLVAHLAGPAEVAHALSGTFIASSVVFALMFRIPGAVGLLTEFSKER